MKKTLSVEFIKSAAQPSDFPPPDLPEVAAIGRSNVGKSSLLNRLTGAKRMAFVSKTPGRTQLVNFFRLSGDMTLVDLPGYGFAKVPASVRQHWEKLVTAYLFERETLRLGLLLVDIRRDPMESDIQVRDLLVHNGVAHAVVATKADKLSKSRVRQQRTKLERIYGAEGKVPLITFSAVTNEGRNELWKVIERHIRRAPKK
jgi:GTP-binding protein